MLDEFRDECGVFGILDHEDAANLVYLGLYALQHRGQESAGIASLSTDPIPSEANIGRVGETSGTGERSVLAGAPQIHVEKEMGYVADVFTHERLSRLPGRLAIGHVRYSTAGGSMLCNAQPLVASTHKGPIAIAHNGNFVNGNQLRLELEAEGAIFNTMSDTEVLVHLVARSKEPDVERALIDAFSRVRGAYSIVALTPGRIIAARDHYGFRPLALGRLGDTLCVSSETCAFDLIEAVTVREVRAGEIVVLERDGEGGSANRIRVLREPEPEPEREARCIFEHVYFARPDSNVFGQNVGAVRKRFGAQLAIEHPADADLVAPVPDSGVFAALGYAQRSGLPFEFALVRNHYVGRTFIEPKQSIRHFGVKVKLNAVREIVRGKRLVLVDDSIVRGTTSRKIVKMLKAAGALEVHMRISSPPTTGPCYYGIDTPKRRELIGSTHTIEQIREFIDADSLGYLSESGMLDAVRTGTDNPERLYCTACFSGRYPVLEREQEAALAKSR
ncbi:MAG TPA: amidophosphoribosyltransferase [Thermoanaerobaculia bacterium]|nr:amidophosphoribosyltransferase [Thermoanaerobaculia bacterium]